MKKEDYERFEVPLALNIKNAVFSVAALLHPVTSYSRMPASSPANPFTGPHRQGGHTD
jgi:hypothetical protein